MAVDKLVLRHCAVCGIFAPQVLPNGAKIVSMPCAHNKWVTVTFVLQFEEPRPIAFQNPRYPPSG